MSASNGFRNPNGRLKGCGRDGGTTEGAAAVDAGLR